MSEGPQERLSALDHLLDETDVTASLAGDLSAVVDALESSPALRRAVTDPGTPEQARREFVRGLLTGKVSDQAVDFVAEAAGQRWAGGRTFAAALERQAVRAVLVRADQDGALDETEDELFRFARLVESNPDLRNALADRTVGLSERQNLVGELLDGKTTPATAVLARRAVLARERSFGNTIEGYVTLAAEQKNRVIATVRVARPLDDEQIERLRRALRQQVGRDVAIQVLLDPEVMGGVRVELANEVIEGTVASRLDEARRLFS